MGDASTEVSDLPYKWLDLTCNPLLLSIHTATKPASVNSAYYVWFSRAASSSRSPTIAVARLGPYTEERLQHPQYQLGVAAAQHVPTAPPKCSLWLVGPVVHVVSASLAFGVTCASSASVYLPPAWDAAAEPQQYSNRCHCCPAR